MRWLAAATVSCACFSLAAFGTLAPLRDAAGIQYAFVWPGAAGLLGGTAAAALALGLLYRTVVRAARNRAPERIADAQGGRWLAPMALPGVCILGLAPALPGAGQEFAALGYFFYDLRWWWAGGAVLGAAAGADGLTGRRVARRFEAIADWPVRARLLFFDAVVLGIVVLCATAATRHLRFDPGLHGDEPKYIRYAESWYQGRGFEVSGNRPVRELPLDGGSRVLHNVTLLAGAVREEGRALASDLRAFASDPRGFRWNRAERHEGFVTGKRGGLYQIYMPGVSFFLFPGYFIDRHVLALRASEAGEFPSELVMTNVSMLLLYGLSAVTLFRFFRRALGSEPLAAFWSVVAMLAFPAGAFAFQFYPEIPALLVIVMVTTYVSFHAGEARPSMAAAAGLGTAGLAWFHPRFLLVSLVFLVAGTVRTRRPRSRAAFVCGAAAAYASVLAFAYRVTGSFMPTALWDAPGSEPTLNLAAAPITVLGYALDRTWGMAPHTPLLLWAVPGLAVLARDSWRLALLVLLPGLALAVPAAAHTLSAAGTTPGRLIVAIVPLLFLPVAVLVRRFWASRALRAAVCAALVISLETAFTYNWHHIKIMGSMRSMGASGWRPNLAFPVVSGGGWTDFPANVALFFVVAGLLAAATILAVARSRHRAGERLGRHHWLVPGGTLAVIVLAAVGGTSFNRRWVYGDYLMDDLAARRTAAAALVARDDCRLCFATRDAAIDWRWLEPNAADMVEVDATARARTATIRVALKGERGPLGFGRMRAEFGDGSATSWTGIVETGEIIHTYARSGDYSVVVWVQLRNGEMRAGRASVAIQGSPEGD